MVLVQDVRRLSATGLVLAGVLAFWTLVLWLHSEALWEWGLPRRAMENLSFGGWAWINAGIGLVLILVIALPVFGVHQVAGGRPVDAVRQVQCQDCYAVFQIHDTGERPLMHNCPSCRALGIYTGTAPPVGDVPEAVETKIVELQLRCNTCDHRFPVKDTGARPLNVSCPECGAAGRL